MPIISSKIVVAETAGVNRDQDAFPRPFAVTIPIQAVVNDDLTTIAERRPPVGIEVAVTDEDGEAESTFTVDATEARWLIGALRAGVDQLDALVQS